jgi:hypothetical protein
MNLQGSKVHGYVVARLAGGWRIVEGTGKDGGSWFAVHRFEACRFASRFQAEQHAECSHED